MMIRSLKKKDKEALLLMLSKIDIFTDEEKEIAVELINEALVEKGNGYYNIFVCEENNEILGYHCTGKRSLTEGVFDMYWIVVDPAYQNKGIGKQLLIHAEDFVKENDGYLILAETSSKDSYKNTRSFYKKNNYSALAQIKDFYKFDDDLIVFGKYLNE